MFEQMICQAGNMSKNIDIKVDPNEMYGFINENTSK